MNCTFDPSHSPYKYFDPSNNIILEGISVTVPLPNNQSDIELCVYNTSGFCLTSSSCCKETSFVDHATANQWVPPLLTFFIGYSLGLFFLRFSGIRQRWGVTGPLGLGALHSKKDYQQMETQGGGKNKTKLQILFIVIVGLLYICSIFALVAEAVIMPASIQESLPPADRSSQLAMQSFLAPIEEIFSFIEDTMYVKKNSNFFFSDDHHIIYLYCQSYICYFFLGLYFPFFFFFFFHKHNFQDRKSWLRRRCE